MRYGKHEVGWNWITVLAEQGGLEAQATPTLKWGGAKYIPPPNLLGNMNILDSEYLRIYQSQGKKNPKIFLNDKLKVPQNTSISM